LTIANRPLGLVVANSFLTAEVERLTQAVSFGFIRGRSTALWVHEIKHDGFRVFARKERKTLPLQRAG
jgi:hypothetical protein